MVTAVVEDALVWPAFGVIDRIHPKCKRGEWPRLWSSPQVIAHELMGHALFGASLGILVRWRNHRSEPGFVEPDVIGSGTARRRSV